MVGREEKKGYLNANGGQESVLSQRREKADFVNCFPTGPFIERGVERVALCWFRSHKRGLNPFRGSKSVHRGARSKGKPPCSAAVIELAKKNQAPKGNSTPECGK